MTVVAKTLLRELANNYILIQQWKPKSGKSQTQCNVKNNYYLSNSVNCPLCNAIH